VLHTAENHPNRGRDPELFPLDISPNPHRRCCISTRICTIDAKLKSISVGASGAG